MNGSDLIVKALINEGVTRTFGLPGEENLSLLESLRRSSIELVVTRHEQAAAFMAATHGRLTGKPGVAISTLGPGALNFSTGAAYALLGGMPMILITGQKPLIRNQQGQFQMIDVVAAMRPLTKCSRQINSAFTIPASISEALALRRPLQTLTERQVQVLRLVAEGHRTRDIAKRLGLSVKTVESHRGEIMKRLGVHDVVSLVRYAIRVGLIPLTFLVGVASPES